MLDAGRRKGRFNAKEVNLVIIIIIIIIIIIMGVSKSCKVANFRIYRYFELSVNAK